MYLFILPAVLVCKLEVHELPTFRPNDFFWNKYKNSTKDRSEVYAEVIREIMHENCKVEYPNRDTDVYDKYKLEDDYYAILRKTKGV